MDRQFAEPLDLERLAAPAWLSDQSSFDSFDQPQCRALNDVRVGAALHQATND
jgi:hypothetical protein